ERSLVEHEALMAEADAPELLRRTGWIKLFRSQASLDKGAADLERARQFAGIAADVLDPAAIEAREPHLDGRFSGAIHWGAPGFVPDPGKLAKTYADLFVRNGGRFLTGDARTLEQDSSGWRLRDAQGNAVIAREAVVALGPWSDLVF